MPNGNAPPPALPSHAILEWLSAPAQSNIAEEARQLNLQLTALHSPTIQSSQFHSCIELFYGRVLRLSAEHRHELREQALPLPTSLLNRTRLVADALKRIALGFERTLTDVDTRTGAPQKRLNETISARALRLLGEHFLTVAQAGIEADPDIWRIAYRLYALSRNDIRALEPAGSPAETALVAYKRLLAMESLEPQSLSPGELDWTAEYLTRICNQVHVQELPPPAQEGPWYWLDPNGGADPHACVRRAPPPDKSLLFFSTSGLARRASEQLARYEDGHSDNDLHVDANFPGVQPIALLERLRQRWSAPQKRELPRRRQDYRVDACIGLPNIWGMLHRNAPPEDDLISNWTVLNESPGGYSIMHLQGRCSGLVSGMAVALRRDASEPWNLCIVRWIRSDAENQVEIGLQMVSRGAIPVQIGFRGNAENTDMVRALVLPVLPALRQHQAIMAPAGTYISRRFTLVSDVDRIYVAQCRLLTLDFQTSNIELFQFELDPYPI